MVQIENIVFDPTYYLLAAALTIAFVYTAALGFRLRRRLSAPADRERAFGTALTAVGAAVANTGALTVVALGRNGLIGGVLYLQVEFLIVYAGFGAVIYGVVAILSAVRESGINIRWPGSNSRLRVLLFSAYALAVGFSSVYLLNPATYTISYSGATQHVAQQTVFWFPVFLTLSFGIIAMLPAALKSKEVDARRHALWFVLFAALVLLGLMREATIIPSSGDPLTDLLVAFVPLTVGGFSLYESSRMLQASASRVAPVDLSAGPTSLLGQHTRDT